MESHQRKGVGEVKRRVDFFVVVSVVMYVLRCGAIAGYWSGSKEP